MSRFRFQAIDPGGRRHAGIVEATSRAEAHALAAAGGLRVIRLDPAGAGGSIWSRDLLGGGVTGAELAALIKDLATLLGAELTIDRALRLAQRQAPKSLREPLAAVLADILAGVALSRALARHPGIFPIDLVEVAAAGERTGTLGPVLGDLALSLERREAIRRTIVSALIYPALLLVMAFAIVGIVIGILVPSLAPLFDQPGVEAPAVIRLVQGSQRLWAVWWPALLAGLGGSVVVLAATWRRPGFAAARETLLFRAPLLGPVLAGVEAGRICRVLGTLLSARVPVPEAIAATRRVPRSRRFQAAIDEAARRIPEGARMAAALSALGRLSPLTLQMVATGEEVNRVPDMLLHAAELHEAAVKTRIDRLFAVMTPLITGAMGIGIGGLILSIMSAIFSVNDLAMR